MPPLRWRLSRPRVGATTALLAPPPCASAHTHTHIRHSGLPLSLHSPPTPARMASPRVGGAGHEDCRRGAQDRACGRCALPVRLRLCAACRRSGARKGAGQSVGEGKRRKSGGGGIAESAVGALAHRGRVGGSCGWSSRAEQETPAPSVHPAAVSRRQRQREARRVRRGRTGAQSAEETHGRRNK